MKKSLKKCHNCKKDLKTCANHCIGDNIICKRCGLCKVCSKQIYNIKNYCDTCCKKCQRCDKILIKNNWPIDIIIDNMCEKCNHVCILCNKYLPFNKIIYKKTKNKKSPYCTNCFSLKFLKEKKYQCTPITRKESYGNLFLNWKKIKKLANCICCGESGWINMRYENSNYKCKKCIKKNNKNSNNKNNKNKSVKLGSIKEEKTKKYIFKNHNSVDQWVKIEEQKKCNNCLTTMWISLQNIKKANNKETGFLCKNCSPNTKRQKFIYDDALQQWKQTKKLISCSICHKEKWIIDFNATSCVRCRKKKESKQKC